VLDHDIGEALRSDVGLCLDLGAEIDGVADEALVALGQVV